MIFIIKYIIKSINIFWGNAARFFRYKRYAKRWSGFSVYVKEFCAGLVWIALIYRKGIALTS